MDRGGWDLQADPTDVRPGAQGGGRRASKEMKSEIWDWVICGDRPENLEPHLPWGALVRRD